MSYLLIKAIHVLSAVVLIGTGAGIAFFMLMAVRTRSAQVIHQVARIVIVADWVFTAPAVLAQLISGLYLMHLLNYSFTSLWFYTVICLFVLVGLCWLPVVVIQYKLKNLSQSGMLAEGFDRWFRIWWMLGIPAFVSILILFWLMISKWGTI